MNDESPANGALDKRNHTLAHRRDSMRGLTPTERVVRVVRDVGGEAPRDLLVCWLEPTLGRRNAALAVRLALVAGLVDADEYDAVRLLS